MAQNVYQFIDVERIDPPKEAGSRCVRKNEFARNLSSVK